jgi:hypothetical protein
MSKYNVNQYCLVLQNQAGPSENIFKILFIPLKVKAGTSSCKPHGDPVSKATNNGATDGKIEADIYI